MYKTKNFTVLKGNKWTYLLKGKIVRSLFLLFMFKGLVLTIGPKSHPVGVPQDPLQPLVPFILFTLQKQLFSYSHFSSNRALLGFDPVLCQVS